jgi:hypothetical protein
MDFGGSWVNPRLSFDSITQSICLLFVVATTVDWLPFVFKKFLIFLACKLLEFRRGELIAKGKS